MYKAVLIADNYSTDSSVEIATKHGAFVIIVFRRNGIRIHEATTPLF